MFASKGGIEIWDDDVYCQIDVRSQKQEAVETVLEFAQAPDCILVLPEARIVIPPDVSLLQKEIEASMASAFVSDPKGTLAGL